MFPISSFSNILIFQGSHSSQDEQGTAALKTVEIDDRLGGAAVQVRVIQGKEPAHFLAMFQGQLIVYKGGHSSSFDGEESQDQKVADTHLLQIHGRTPLTTFASEVSLKGSSLNTNDCFVLVAPQGSWVWLGKGSTGDEKEMAKGIGNLYDKDPTMVYEGQEKDEFWSLLGGKEAYADEFVLRGQGENFTPRLFHGSNASGSFKSNFFWHILVDFSHILYIFQSIFVIFQSNFGHISVIFRSYFDHIFVKFWSYSKPSKVA